MKHYIGTFSALSLIFIARSAYAIRDLNDLVSEVGETVNNITGLLSAVALLVFIWGLVKFIAKAGNEQAREEGKKVMVWGIVAIFVLFSIWGIIGFIENSLELPERGGGGGGFEV